MDMSKSVIRKIRFFWRKRLRRISYGNAEREIQNAAAVFFFRDVRKPRRTESKMKLSFQEFHNKVYGCYLGKNIGGTLGAPFEGFRGLYHMDWFMQDVSEPVPNDDVDLQLVWLRAAERAGRDIDSHVLEYYWNTYISATLCEYGTGKNNFNQGAVAPLSGYLRNQNRDSNGAWIRSEIWACLCAGSPWLAATYAYYDSSVDHSGEGVYAAVFTATMQSAAFFESDVEKLTEIALSYIPEDCAVARAVRCALDCYHTGKTWEETRIALFRETPSSFGQTWRWEGIKGIPVSEICPEYFPDPAIPRAEPGFDAPWSIGAIVAALLYGGGDFGKTICTATNMGEDTDCTAGTAGSIIGIILGADGIPEKWKNAVSDRIVTCTLCSDADARYPKTVEELTFRLLKVAPEFLRDKCVFAGTERVDAEHAPDWAVGGYEVASAASLAYDKSVYEVCNTDPEDIKELLKESPDTVRRHYHTLTVTAAYDESLVKIRANGTKKMRIGFINKLIKPQYLTVKLHGVPEDWTVNCGKEFCVGLEHLHGGSNRNAIELEITTGELNRASYTIVMEMISNGRSEREYFPITFLNGCC